MEFDIDARGLACPKPVVMTKEALAQGRGPFTILVDNEAARDNVSRFAGKSGCAVEVGEHQGGYLLKVTPVGDPEQQERKVPAPDRALLPRKVLFIGSDEVGRGDRELGITLSKALLYACTENEDRASSIVFMNSGVRLVTENEETVGHVRRLESEGAEIVVCGTCLDFYGLKERLQVGRVSNMYEIQSILLSADSLISI